MKNSAQIYKRAIFVFLAISLGVYACKLKNTPDDLFISNWQPTLTLPLVSSSLNLKNIVEKQKANLIIEEDADGYYTFIYYSDFDSLEVSKLSNFKFADQSFPGYSYTLPIPVNTPGNTFTVTQNNNFTITPPTSGQRIDKLLFKGGTISMPVSSTYRHNLALRLSIPNLTKNGQAFDQTVSVLSGGSAVNPEFSLDGYTMDFTKTGVDNRIAYTIQLTFTYVSPTNFLGSVALNAGLKNIEFKQLEGYFGQLAYELPGAGVKDTISLNIFNNAFGSGTSFADAKLNFDVTNSFGIPITLDLSNRISLYSRFPLPGPHEEVFHSPDIDQPVQIKTPNIIGTSALTPISVPLVFQYVPYKILSSADLLMNPSGPTSTANFVTDESKIKVRATAIVPMRGKIASALEFADTILLNMGDLELDDKNEIQYVKFRTNFKNGFPLVGNFQMYFLGDNGAILDSLRSIADENIALPQATIVDGKVISPAIKMYETLINREKFKRIKTSKKSMVKATLKTATNGEVKIYSSYFLDVKLSIEGQINYNLNQ